jgi:hypothetical protein
VTTPWSVLVDAQIGGERRSEPSASLSGRDENGGVGLDTLLGTAQEIDAKTFVDRGLGCELTDLEVSGKQFCSLGFEAFPDDAAMHEAFFRAVSAFLVELKNVKLSVDKSMSYPRWLGQFQM